MSGRYLLDANAVIATLVDDPALEAALNGSELVYISATVLGELYFGAEKSTQRVSNHQRIEELERRFNVVRIDAQTARCYGAVKARLKAKGRPIPGNDIWIAATAIQHGLVLVTRDAHFAEVDGIVTLAW